MHFKKGQGSFEYLLLIGAAILIGLIVISVALNFATRQRAEIAGAGQGKLQNITKQGEKLIENCFNGLDDDNGGKIDVDDVECNPSSSCYVGSESNSTLDANCSG
jgi:hypothetical protein